MKVAALIENTKPEGRDDLVAEHGLSLDIECNDKRVLFDTGASEAFEQNARKLGINLQDVDVLVISHHHYDHGGGLARFLEVNHEAMVYLRKSEEEDFYFRLPGIMSRYIGLDQNLLQKQADRFEFIDRFTEVLPDVYILTAIPAKYSSPKGNRRLFVKKGKTFIPDSFRHELIMVQRAGNELVVFTGCAHNGILNMVAAVTEQFPDMPIKGVFGGFHLVGIPKLNTMAGSKAEVRAIGEELLGYPIERIYTGHCTGQKAYRALKGVLAEKLEYFPTGSEVVL
jgi:7,8-dihydropterin-6-yl-methyl-4-(beta-D-ribofuranosyl)aminobenzene 5'-phosphate synthase